MQLTALSLALTRIGLRGLDAYSPALNLDLTSGNQTLDPRITFSRASNATVTGPDGVLRYAPHNLLTYSEQFDNATWLKTNATVTANAANAPNGLLTADLFAGNGTGAHYLYQSYTAAVGVPFLVSCYVKNFSLAGNQTVWIRDFTDAGRAEFNLLTGTVKGFSGTASEPSITVVGDGWYRISTKFTPTIAGNHNVSPVHIEVSNTLSGFYIWGAQLNVGSLQPYCPTTVKNLLGYTQEFDNGAWLKTRSSITADVAVDPQGYMTADKLVIDTTASANHNAGQSQAVISGTTYTLSMYAKAAEFSQINLRFSAQFPAGNTFFDLSSGTKTNFGSVVDSTITNVGNGWYRCSFTQTANASGTAAAQVFLAQANGITITTANGTDGVLIWGAQLSESASLDPYVYNPGAAPAAAAYYGPRFDYDPVTLQPKGLLIEEQRTNLLTYSEQFDNAAWTKPNALVAANVVIAPDGSMTADKIFDNTAAGVEHYTDQVYLATSGSTYTFSVFCKQAEKTYIRLRAAISTPDTTATFSLSDGTVVNSGFPTDRRGIVSAGNGWYRCWVTYTATATGTVVNRVQLLQTGSSSVTVYTGDGTSGIYIWGAQLEAGAFATSYIPTTTAAATRAADVAVMTGANFLNWYNQSEGTLFGEVNCYFPTSNQYFLSADADAFNRLSLYNTSNTVIWFVRNGGATQSGITEGSITANSVIKIAGCYKANDFNISVNGSVDSGDNSGTLPTVSSLYIGAYSVGAFLNGHIRRIAYWPRRLTNTELQGVTS